MDVKNIEDVSPSTAAQSSLLRSADGRAEAGQLCGLWGCSLRGRLSEQAWRRAWREAARRHPLLRSAFVWKRVENPLRVVYRDSLQAPAEQDWRGLSKEQQAERLKAHKLAERERGFNPAQPPLLRVFLCRTAEDVYQLLCSYSPLTLDEEALALLVAEVRARHETLLGGREASPEDERPFEEYLARRERSDYAGAERFWRLELEGFEAPTSLAGSTRERAEGESVGDDLRETQTELTESETETLLTRARNLGVSLGALAQSAWALLLANHTGQEDVTFGLAVEVAKGAQDEVGGASCGLPANTIPVRVPVPPHASAQSFLKAQESGMVERARHAFASPEQIRWWGGLPPGEPLFESRLVLREATRGASREGEGLYVEAAASFEFDSLPLSVEVTNDTRLALRIVFEAGRFDESAATRLLAHFRALLEGLASEPERPLWAVPMLTEDERGQVLAAWNDTQREYPRQQPIQQLFEAEATRAPDAVAVVSAEGELTYDTLNRRANQLAHYLRALGVGPEVAVALCVERSVEMIVALLGILKAGGAYVPLDPDYPLERLDFMLQDVAAPVLVTTSRLIERLPAHWGQVVSLDEDAGEIALESPENPPRLTGADNLAYVMYTSGSTGQPKGVGVVHRGVVRLVKSADYARLSPEEVVLQFAPLSFDASTFEIWGALLNGARLVLMQPQAASLEEVGAALKRHGVTTMWLTAGLFHLLADEQPEQLGGLRQLLAGGDVLSAEHVRKALRSMRSGSLVNGYGPTESTTFACCCPLTDESQFGSNVPIGRPISNTEVFLLDRHLRPVPPGATGELHIGGDGLARAYVNRPELTAERFIPNPFGREGGERLYKTGDLARHLPDGRIEFLGRSDFQVKVRGFRIELGEIETMLGSHPSVRRCVVLARQDSPGEKQLTAYVVPEEGRELTPTELRRYLRNQLPDYMIPSQLVLLDALPLTPNGKVDRHALPAPVVARAADDSSFAEPTTPEERVLAEVWRQVLGLERVGVHDNFFDLGGDSIRSIQIRSQALRRGYEFSVQELFRHQTIAELAREMKPNGAWPRRSARTEPFSLISEEERLRLPSDVEDAYPLTQLQNGMIFHSSLETRTPLYHEVVSFHLRAPLDAGALGEALRRMASRHPVLRTSFDLDNFAEPLQLVHRDVTIPLALTDLGHLPHEEQERALAAWMEDEQRNTFAPSQRPPLMRCTVFRRGAEEFQFTISFHHAIFDGWSMSTMLTELFSIYFSLLDPGRAYAELPPPTSTLRDFVALEREALRSEEARRFWTEKLAGGVQTSLPESKESSPPESNGRHAAGEGKRTLSVQFGPELVEELRTLARCAAAPLKSVLLAAHLRALGLLCGQTEVVTGLVTNGRPEEADGERVLGLFLNTVPLTMALDGGTWIDLVQAAYEAELEVSPYRRFPLTELQKGRGGRPIFETAFNYTHFHVTQKMREVADVEVLGMESFSHTSFPFSVSFDLNPATSGVVLFLEYDAARYGERQVEEVADSYRRVLTAMARDPFARHEHAPLLREEERHRLLYEWNDTGAPFAGEACLHELFEAQAERSPEAVAVIFEGQSATYAELNRRSNQLAHHLRSLGVGPETLVAVMMERSAELIVALLGVLKAGGAY
ncbi:MAG TPA: amino acid adenylation domain-containing protein, partial [Pyrinomonadaceae bacterium]|nr:amino acid adenylation domain-containing protein [Pyrinomonadaceae bacterium]